VTSEVPSQCWIVEEANASSAGIEAHVRAVLARQYADSPGRAAALAEHLEAGTAAFVSRTPQ
jgi:hypothetical protein